MTRSLPHAMRFAAVLALALFTSCASTQGNRATARRVFERLWSRGDLAVIEETLAPNYTWNENSNTGSNRENYRAFVKVYRTAFPDLTFEIQQMVSSDDIVVVRWIARGTHTGALADLAPTGKQVAVNGITILRIVDGRALREWTTWDEAGMLAQLGVAP